jgi:hypothetical protein
MNVATIRTNLATALATVTGLSVAKYRNAPCDGFPRAILSIDSIGPQDLGDQSYEIGCTVTLVVSESETPEGWADLDLLLSSNTIRDALTAASSVAYVGGYDNIGNEIEFDGGTALGCTIAVLVYA